MLFCNLVWRMALCRQADSDVADWRSSDRQRRRKDRRKTETFRRENRMRWSIRQQVLVPIVAIQSLTIIAMTLASVALAERRTERQILNRLNGVVEMLRRSNFPLSEGVLARMQELSGARFVAYGRDR